MSPIVVRHSVPAAFFILKPDLHLKRGDQILPSLPPLFAPLCISKGARRVYFLTAEFTLPKYLRMCGGESAETLFHASTHQEVRRSRRRGRRRLPSAKGEREKVLLDLQGDIDAAVVHCFKGGGVIRGPLGSFHRCGMTAGYCEALSD